MVQIGFRGKTRNRRFRPDSSTGGRAICDETQSNSPVTLITMPRAYHEINAGRVNLIRLRSDLIDTLVVLHYITFYLIARGIFTRSCRTFVGRIGEVKLELT